MTKFDLPAAQQRDIHLDSNVFTAGYAGLMDGVELSLDKGSDPLRPRDPSINIAGAFIARDRFVDRELGPRGCIYHPEGGLKAMVYRAVVHTVTPERGKPFKVLRTPTAEKPTTSLLKVSIPLPKGIKVKAIVGADDKEHALRVWSGIRTTGTPVLAYDGEALVELKSGEQLTVFFEDGFVRQYQQEEAGLVEIELKPADMAELRIEDAQLRLAVVTPAQWPDPVRRERQQHFILAGMVDLFHLAAKDEGVRKDLAQFFFNLDQPLLGLVHRKLTAVLHQVDLILAYTFSSSAATTNVAPLKPKPVDSDAARKRALADQKKADKRLEDQKKRAAMKGSTSGKGK